MRELVEASRVPPTHSSWWEIDESRWVLYNELDLRKYMHGWRVVEWIYINDYTVWLKPAPFSYRRQGLTGITIRSSSNDPA